MPNRPQAAVGSMSPPPCSGPAQDNGKKPHSWRLLFDITLRRHKPQDVADGGKLSQERAGAVSRSDERRARCEIRSAARISVEDSYKAELVAAWFLPASGGRADGLVNGVIRRALIVDGENLARLFHSNTFKETAMLRATVAAIAILVSQAALAANPSCEAQATEKKLSGAAKNSFVTKCEKDAKAAVAMTCDAQAAEKKLAGAAKTSFVTKCENDAKAAVMKTCEAEAAEKKLAGAAKDSFTKKCVTDAAAATK